MSKDIVPAVVINNENSGVYLVVVADKIGSEKPTLSIILPGQSSDLRHESIDALAAFSVKDGQPVNLQLIPMLDNEVGNSAHWWKYPDGSHGTVRMQDGKPVLDMQFNLYKRAPTPSEQKVWGVDELPKPAHLDHKQQSASLNDQLEEYLRQNYTSSDVMRVLAAVNEKMAAQQARESGSERTT